VCLQCHNTTSWTNVSFDHRAIWRDYTGAHTRVPCQSCHPGGRFNPPPNGTLCSNCHGAPHGQCLNNEGVGCVVCHSTSGWSNTTFNHRDYWTWWSGAHTGNPCGDCHPSSGNTYTFCQLNQGSGTCVGCHAFGNTGHGYSTGSSNYVCLDCHTTSAFWPLTSSWEHLITLGGFHAQSNVRPDGSSRCNLCHTGYNMVNSPRSCGVSGCHSGGATSTPQGVTHGPSFVGSNCVTCHNPAAAFEPYGSSNTRFVHPSNIWEIHTQANPPVDVTDCRLCHPASPTWPTGNFDVYQCQPCHIFNPPPPWNP